MDFLKKNYDKLALAVGLLALITSAVLLSMKAISINAELGEAPRRAPKFQPLQSIDFAVYSNAIASLNQPPLWTSVPQDPFNTSPRDEAGITNIVIVNGGPPIQLLKVAKEPFKLLFKAYSGDGYNFQLNFQFRSRTFIIPSTGEYVADRYENTGYKITGFEKKLTSVLDPALGGRRDKDVSELTLRHEGEEPITLVLGQEAEQREPVATIRCGALPQPQQVRRGQRLECEGKAYIVVDISPRQMLIVDAQSEEKHTIGLSAARE